MTDNKYIGVQGLEELINLTKNSLAKKADTLQFNVMPDPVKYIRKVVQYVGISDASYTRSHFYYSDGTRWNEENMPCEQTTQIKIVNALPAWISADPNILYILKGATDNTMSLYVKNASVNGAWFTVESGGSFAIVDSLPQWSDANDSTIYFKANGDALAGYIKNTEVSDAWYTLGGATQEIDTALSSASTNPVQNKVVYAAIQDVLAKVVTVYHFKGSCKVAALPSEGNAVGDTWNLEDDSSYGPAGVNVAWTGTEWNALSGSMSYMRGLHDPDWSALESHSGLIIRTSIGTHNIFTCPARGNLTICVNGSPSYVEINSIDILLSNFGSSPRFVSIPVNEGDVFSITTTSDYPVDVNYFYAFVPYKVQ